MSLKIVVLAKQVPDTRNVGKDAMKADGTINRAALPAIFNPEDLDNADIISMVESSPTYLRDKSTLSTIKTKAATEGQLATEEAQGGEDMGGVITF